MYIKAPFHRGLIGDSRDSQVAAGKFSGKGDRNRVVVGHTVMTHRNLRGIKRPRSGRGESKVMSNPA